MHRFLATIVFTRHIDKHVRKYGPKGERFTITPAGTGLRRLTNRRVGQQLFGTSPTQFSADGTRLLAQFGGQDTSYAQVVNPATGRIRTLGKAEARRQGTTVARCPRTGGPF